MTKEIEIKLEYADRAAIIGKLKELGAKKISESQIKDVYYGEQGSDMSNVHKQLRVRIKDGKAELTFKGKAKETNNVWERTEINVGITEPQKLMQIIELLGFQKNSENESRREKWELDGVEIMFIDYLLPRKLSMIEVEGPSTEKVSETTKKFGNLVKEIDESAFKRFDDSRKN